MKLSDLTLIQWLGIVLVINGAITGSVGEMTDLLGAVWAKHLVSIATIGSGIVGGVITMFGGIGTQARNVVAAGGARIEVSASPQTSPALAAAALDDKTSGIVPARGADAALSVIAKILLLAFALSLLFLPASHAMAQGQRSPLRLQAPTVTDAATGEKKCLLPLDPLKLCGDLTGKPEEDMQRIVKRIQGVGRDDMNYAILKATAANTNGSKVRLQCLQAILAAKDAAEGTAIKDASGNVIPRPDPAIVTTIEDTAELVDALGPQGPLWTSCAGAAQLFKTNVLQVVNAFVTGAAGIAALPAGL